MRDSLRGRGVDGGERLCGAVGTQGARGLVPGAVAVGVGVAAGVPHDADGAEHHAVVENGGAVGDHGPGAGELVGHVTPRGGLGIELGEPVGGQECELGVGEEHGPAPRAPCCAGEAQPRTVEVVQERVGRGAGVDGAEDFRAPGGGEQDAVAVASQERVKQVVAGEAGEPDLPLGERVGGVIGGEALVLGGGGGQDDVEAHEVEPPPHVPHGDAVLEEDDALIAPRSTRGEPVADDGVADIGEQERAGLLPRRGEGRLGGVNEVETLGGQTRPVGAGALDGEKVADAGSVLACVAVEGLGVVSGGVVPVHVEPYGGRLRRCGASRGPGAGERRGGFV